MYAFGEFVLDLQLYQLRQAEQPVPLEPKVFDVLRYLIEHRDRVATKQELLAALWPNEVVTEAVLPTNINALRRALGQQ
ncbi:MAG TPA: winged helix-turn-helix domain-containing protein, partial [Polyangiales bacterium]